MDIWGEISLGISSVSLPTNSRSSLECPWSASLIKIWSYYSHYRWVINFWSYSFHFVVYVIIFNSLFDININDDDNSLKLWWYLMISSSHKSWIFLAHPNRCIKAAWRNFGSCYDCFHLWGKFHQDQMQGNGLLDSHDLGIKGCYVADCSSCWSLREIRRKSQQVIQKKMQRRVENKDMEKRKHIWECSFDIGWVCSMSWYKNGHQLMMLSLGRSWNGPSKCAKNKT